MPINIRQTKFATDKYKERGIFSKKAHSCVSKGFKLKALWIANRKN